MNKKGTTIVCTIGIILAVICVVYILFNSGRIETPKKQEENPEEQEIVHRPERSQEIVLSSRVGTQLTNLIRVSNLYSSRLIEELDNNGISNKFKILTAFDKIISKEEYQNLIGYSQTYSNTYVLASNMQITISNLFVDDEFTNENIDGILYYDDNTDSYAMITTGAQGFVADFVVEIPYKIYEYTDRIELLAYRVYVNQAIENIDGEDTIETDIYYDVDRTDNVLSFTNISEFYESNQIEFLKEKIDEGTISESKLEQVKYTIVKEGDNYKFSNYEKITK